MCAWHLSLFLLLWAGACAADLFVDNAVLKSPFLPSKTKSPPVFPNRGTFSNICLTTLSWVCYNESTTGSCTPHHFLEGAAMTNLTPKQQRIYDFIRTFTRDMGYPPTLREIGQNVGVRLPLHGKIPPG